MEDTSAFVEVNIKQECPDEENTEENIIYLPVSQETVKLETDFETDDPIKINTEYETEEKQDITSADNFSNGFFHVNMKTENHNLSEIEDYSSMNLGVLEPEIEIYGKSLEVKEAQAESRFKVKTDGEAPTREKPQLESQEDQVTEFSCNMCGERFDQKSLNSHINKHTSENTFIRQIGEVRSHPKDNSLECKTCKLKFTNRLALSRHISTHTKAEQPKCTVRQMKLIKTGVKNAKPNTEVKSHECNVCHKIFAHSSYMRVHMLIHSGIKPHECNICHKKFVQSNSLKMHVLTHSGVKQYECNVCHKKFTRPDGLRTHKLTHSGVKMYECNVCHKKFTQSGSLKTHVMTHSGVKPHECNICHKTFSQFGNLNIHLLTHSGAKPHECNICHKKFRQSGDLKAHLLTHSGVKPHECNICKKKFGRASILKKHSSVHSKVKTHE